MLEPTDRDLAVEVVDLLRRYGTFDAVRGISFQVRAPGTVHNHLSVAATKLGARNRHAAVEVPPRAGRRSAGPGQLRPGPPGW
jgi:hypothetical protein